MPNPYANYIGGRWAPARSGRTFFNLDPATGETLGEYPASGLEDVEDAVVAAQKALPAWRLTPAPKRAEILYRAGEIIKARKEDLARAMTREMGKILIEARGDVQEGIDMAYLAEEVDVRALFRAVELCRDIGKSARGGRGLCVVRELRACRRPGIDGQKAPMRIHQCVAAEQAQINAESDDGRHAARPGKHGDVAGCAAGGQHQRAALRPIDC
jgi:hypothetical protein